MNQDVKDRIFSAADRLHAASETQEFPTVEQVRKEARASMNNVVEALKEWRQKQRSVVRAVMEPLPESLHQAVLNMGYTVWKTAQDKANDAMEAARAGFEAEKTDLTRLSLEQSHAFEQQALELETLRAELTQTADALADARQVIETQAQQSALKQEKLGLAEARAEEIQKRADGLQVELARVHDELASVRMDGMRAAAEAAQCQGELKSLREQVQEQLGLIRAWSKN